MCAPMLTLVTGASGYLGVEMVRQLRAQGREVRALIRRWDAEQLLSGTGAYPALGDVTDPGSLAPALEGVSRVFHMAGVVGHRASDEQRLHDVNVIGSAKPAGGGPAGRRRADRLHVQRGRDGAGRQSRPSPERAALPARRRRRPR